MPPPPAALPLVFVPPARGVWGLCVVFVCMCVCVVLVVTADPPRSSRHPACVYWEPGGEGGWLCACVCAERLCVCVCAQEGVCLLCVMFCVFVDGGRRDLSATEISGSIPESIGQLTQLTKL